MKFEYNKDGQGDVECVAFIDTDGDLWIELDGCDDNNSVLFSHQGKPHAGICTIEEGIAQYGSKKKLYPGDKITITF